MKDLNNDWETIEFEAITPEQLLAERANNANNLVGTDPYNSGTRWQRPSILDETIEIKLP